MKQILLCLALALMGCVHQTLPSTPIPGAVNQFDSNAYRTLATVHAFVESAASNPSVLTPGQKSVLNKLIADLNAADRLYPIYHAGAADQAAMQAALDTVSNDQSVYVSASGVK